MHRPILERLFTDYSMGCYMKEKYWEGMEEYPVPEAEGIRDYIQGLAREIDEAFGDMEDKYHPAHLGVDNGLKLYALLREKKPSVVVETGVCNGMSSAVILKALEDNDHGRLYSVDLPVTAGSKEGRTGAVLPPGRSSGWVIPDELRGRWELFTGNTYYELPGVFQKVRGGGHLHP